MKTFFWICFFFLIPGMLLRIPVGGAGILATDIVLPLFSFTWLFYKISKQEIFPQNSFILPGIIFFIFAFFTFLWGSGELFLLEKILSGAYLLRFFSILVFGWAAQDIFRTQNLINSFFSQFFLISFVVVFLGFLQFYLVPDISDWSTEGGLDPHQGRLLGTWLDPNFLAGFIAFLLPLTLGFRENTSSQRVRYLLLFFFAVLLYALFLTFSRSGYLAGLAGLFLFFFFRNKKILVLGAMIALLGLSLSERAQSRVEELTGTMSAVLFQDTDEIDPTAIHRLESWNDTLTLWKKYPWGIGYNTYRYRASNEGLIDENYFSSGGSDSTLLTLLVTTGILGLALFLFFYFRILFVSFSFFQKTKHSLGLGFCSGLLALFVHSFFVNSLLFPFVFMSWIAVAGVLESQMNISSSPKILENEK